MLRRRSHPTRHGWALLIVMACTGTLNGQANPTLAPAVEPDRQSFDAGPAKTDELSHYATMPLAFEENRGQLDARVRYVARAAGRTVFLTADETVLALQTDPAQPASVIRQRFDGAGLARLTGEDALPTLTHYYGGRTSGKPHTQVRSFGKVRYHELYPGIDLVYYGNRRGLEYDLVLAPHADARRIGLRFEGTRTVDIDRDGDLVLTTRDGELRQKKPVAWQVVRGERRSIDAHYTRRGRGIGIALARYDHRRPLVIDPQVLFHATYLGGGNLDKALALAADAAGNTYIAGLTQSIDFPTANATQPSKNAGADAFVAKLNANGTALVYATYLGGSGVDAALGIARDAAGNAYVAGYTASADFPVTPDAFQSSLQGSAYDAFVARLGADGSLQYSTYLGGSDVDIANAIAVDGAGHAFVAGFTCSPDFPIANAIQPQLAGPPLGCFAAKDAFVAKIQPGAPTLPFSTYLGGGAGDEAKAIAVDAQGRASIAGATASSDFPVEGTPLFGYAGGLDAFVSRLTPSGALDYSTHYGGSADDSGLAIAADDAGSLYVAGSTASADFPVMNAFQPDLHGPGDGFVAKFIVHAGPRATATVAYATFLGGRHEDAARAIAVDRQGYAYVTGETRSIDFPVHLPTQAALRGESDAFVARMGPTGALTYSTFLGANDEDAGWGIALSSGLLRGANNVHVAGVTLSTDLATPGVVQPDWNGSFDGFVCKLGYLP
jgi:hypothetical protein